MPYLRRRKVPFESLQGADPAAGEEGIAFTVPIGQAWLVHAIGIQLVTDSTAVNRRPHLVADDGTNIFGRWAAGTVQGGSLTYDYYPGPIDLGVLVNINLSLVVPLPIRLAAGHRLRTITENLQVADNYGPPTILLERFV